MTNRTRTWNSYDGYLFDIDGTLLTCGGLVHYQAFNNALSVVAGKVITIDGVVMHGNVDVGIMRDAFLLHKVPEEVWRLRKSWIIEEMARFVALNKDGLECTTLPMVPETLQHLKSRGALLGTATGNLRAIGTAKLRLANLYEMFDFCYWSDLHEFRTDVFRAAAEHARSILGGQASLCAVGDTPADIIAARKCGLDVIAVSTGIYSLEELQGKSPDFLVDTFAALMDISH
jgi:phosphoglycolate phosphatase-like HAD superfamily hydrolase